MFQLTNSNYMKNIITFILSFLLFSIGYSQQAEIEKMNYKQNDQLIIRGVTLINGDGSPPRGPIDIVVRKNIISNIQVVGYPGVKIDEKSRPKLEKGGIEINANGMYLMPGFIDMHGHIGGDAQGADYEYVFKLWMAHGVTTVREPSGKGIDWTLNLKKLSAENKIIAPRIFAYTGFGQTGENFNPLNDAPISTAENRKLGLGSACHHAQLSVARWNVLNSARAGLTSMEHWYGLPEALFDDRTVQNYPLDYNYQNEQHRFEEAGKLWKQAAKPYSDHWNSVMDELLSLDFTLDPTFNIYEASRDLQRTRRAEWHEDYTLPSLWKFFEPSKISHGSYWHYWGTEQEIEWKENFRLWMTFINEYKNRGGRVTTGSDSGFIYQLYGFAYIRELELLREAGFHPLEVIRSATLNGAEALNMDDKIGSVQIGKLADFVILEENPLENLKTLYGTGAIKLTEDNEVVRVGGVKYTVKDGIVYDAKKLLEDVKKMVDLEKSKTNWKLKQPGVN